MGENHQYGRDDGTEDDEPQADGRTRGYGQPNPGAGTRGYGRPQPPQSPPPQGQPPQGQSPQGPAPQSGRGYGPPPQQPPQPPPYARGYGGPPEYGSTPEYNRPVDSYGGAPRRGPQQPIRGEVVPGAGGGTRRMPGAPSQGTPPGPPPGAPPGAPPADPYADPYAAPYADPDIAGGYSTNLPPPRRTRLEERQAARAKGGSAAASQERSTQYEPSPLNGRSTRNGAGRPGAGGPGNKRPAKKTGYHRYFDYPRTGKDSWRHWTPSVKQVGSFVLGGFFLLLGLIAFEYYTVQVPTDTTLPQASVFQFDDGSTQFASTGSTTRIEVNLDQVPTMMQDAIVSAENKTFWTDPGVSYTGIVRSFINDAEGKPLQGGSTLTQQYVKNAFLTDNQTFSRKLDEIFISLKMSRSESKDWVLEHYLNTVPFGRNASGVQAAAKLWLNKDISQVTDPADAALLASLVNAPSIFAAGYGVDPNPADAAALVTRWHYVLDQMADNNYITQAQAKTAVFPSIVTVQSDNTPIVDIQMEEAVNSWLDQWATSHPGQNTPTSAEVASGGYSVQTTFNSQDMSLAAQAVQQQLLAKLDPSNWYDQNLEPGLAAVNPKNGDLVAFYGGTTYENNAIQRQVQPGSTFKAFTLSTAYSEGYSENSYMDGTDPWPDKSDPNDAAILATGSYSVVHNDGASGAHVTFNQATADSINTAFVRLEQQVGPSRVLSMVNSFGINDNNALGLNDTSGLTLGIASVSPARMADAYSTFPDNGSEYPLVEVQQITLPGDAGIWKPTVTPANPVTAQVAETVTNTLTNVTHDPGATGCGTRSTCATTQTGLQNIAGKTGTSTMDFSGIEADAANLGPDMKYVTKDQDDGYTTSAIWFNGFTSNLEVAVDVSRAVPDAKGNQIPFPVDNINDGGNAFGAQYPLSIWSQFMKSMQADPTVGGDPAFILPTPNPSASILNSPTAAPTTTPPSIAPTTPVPTDTTTACATNGIGGFFNGSQCPSGTPSDSNTPTNPTESASSTPSATNTKHGLGTGDTG
jgi:membrane peptidoglycan carboxypeptidase